MRRTYRWGLTAAVAAVAIAMPGVASADNEFLDSDPRPGTTVDLEPSRVTIAFGHDVPKQSTTIVVRDAEGKVLTNRDQSVEANNIYANLPYPLPPGIYTVDYRALDGGTPFGGSFEFAWGTDSEPVGLSQWRGATKIPEIVALPGDDALRAAEAASDPTPSTSGTETPEEGGSDLLESAASHDDGTSDASWWWYIPLVVVLGGLALWIAARRRRS